MLSLILLIGSSCSPSTRLELEFEVLDVVVVEARVVFDNSYLGGGLEIVCAIESND